MTDYTLMIAATTGVCSYVAGIVTMGLMAGGQVKKLRLERQSAWSNADHWRAMHREAWQKSRAQGRELAEYRASRQRSTAPLKVANEARKAKRLEREAAAVALRDKTHAKLRELVGG